MDYFENIAAEELKALDTIILYHGTAIEKVEPILKQGLLPWNQSDGHNWNMEGDMFGHFIPRMDHVYFTCEKRAKDIAYYHIDELDSKEGVVIKVHLDTMHLRDDEDSSEKTWYDSLKATGACSHMDGIPVEQILEVKTLDSKVLYSR